MLFYRIIGACILILGVSLISCGDDDVMESDPFESLQPFIGDYSIESSQTVGILLFTDPDGNVIGEGEVTETFSDDLLRISQQGNTDTLLIDGLMRDYESHARQLVQAVVVNDSLNIIYHPDPTNTLENDYIIGKIWLNDQAIFLAYRWDRSDLEEEDFWWGEVQGEGIRIP